MGRAGFFTQSLNESNDAAEVTLLRSENFKKRTSLPDTSTLDVSAFHGIVVYRSKFTYLLYGAFQIVKAATGKGLATDGRKF